ncbi:MAG: PAS domain S-box protein [Ghiorsea sp.]|nr:PAS domain S-box protein [Ghiorsea sp.]
MRILEYSEQLQEAFLHLAHAKQQEEQRRQESDAVLAGLSLLLSAKSHDDVIHILHKVFRQLTGSQMCLVMLRQGNMLVDDAANVSLPIGRSFERVLKGGVLNAFDVSQVPEWENAYEQGVKSALHVPLKLSATTGMLILCSPDKHAFPNTLVDLVRRLVPFAEQAVAKMEALEREHAQEVEAQQALMRFILDHVPVGVWMLGVDGKMKFVNKEFCDVLGVTEQQLLSARRYVDVLGENMAKQCMLSDEQCFAEKTLTHSQETVLCVDGEYHVFDVIKVPVSDEDSQVRCLVGIAVDVTEKLNSAREKEDMQRQILHTQKLESLGVLAGGIAHDFNNILTAIMGHASLAEMEVDDNPKAVEEHLHVIGNASEKAADLCKQMLAYSGQVSL